MSHKMMAKGASDNRLDELHAARVLLYTSVKFCGKVMLGNKDHPIMDSPFPRVKVPANQRSTVPDETVMTHGIPLCNVPKPGPALPAENEVQPQYLSPWQQMKLLQ
jgi:hypothetical protein